MSYEHPLENHMIPIEINIEHSEINAQHIDLVAPIRLIGALNRSKLRAHYQVMAEQDLDTLPLQIGVDEAGRGPLLGSVTVAAAILPSAWSGLIDKRPLKDTPLSTLTDSKQLSEKKRDILYPLVQHYAIGYIIADIPAAVIDQVNILQATMLGMRLCTEALLETIAYQMSIVVNDAVETSQGLQCQVLFDGNRCPDLNYIKLAKTGIEASHIDCQAWVKGDARHTGIAAASVLAKVSRDQTMYQLDAKYPQYGIGKHKGYPTRAHLHAIDIYGVLPEHRRSFAPIKRALEK